MEKRKSIAKCYSLPSGEDNQVLLGLKTKKIEAGCRNGYSGGIEEGESIKKQLSGNLKKKLVKNLVIFLLPPHQRT